MQSASRNLPRFSNPPITKIGVIVRLCPRLNAQGMCDDTAARYMVVQPKGTLRPEGRPYKKSDMAKIPPSDMAEAGAASGDTTPPPEAFPPYVLPRGTRMYLDPKTGKKLDARDEKTARRFAAYLEDPLETAARELEEEAGVPKDLFFNKHPVEFGAWEYASIRSYKGYPIVWYGITLLEEDLKSLTKAVDSARVTWMSLSEYEALVAQGRARAGYAAVIKRADILFG